MWKLVKKTLFILTSLLILVNLNQALAASGKFVLEEATIEDIHAAMKLGNLTARQLVEMYFKRIEAYDKKGPAINSVIMVNPKALKLADDLDAKFKKSGFVGPLHGIPVLLKDAVCTKDMPTTDGSLSLKGSIPPDDAFIEARVSGLEC